MSEDMSDKARAASSEPDDWNTDFGWFQFQCDRSTFSVTVDQPAADNLLAVLEAARRWHFDASEEHAEELHASIAGVLVPRKSVTP